MMFLYAEVPKFILFRLKTVGLRLREGFRENLTPFPLASFCIVERTYLRRFILELLKCRFGDTLEQGASKSFGA